MLLRNHFVGNIAAEIAVITQDILCRLRTNAWVDTRNKNGVGSKMVKYPFAQSFLALDKSIVEPKPYREGDARSGTSQEGVIGGCCKGSSHFLQSHDTHSTQAVIALNLHGFLADIQHFSLGQVLGDRATLHQKCQHQYVYESLYH